MADEIKEEKVDTQTTQPEPIKLGDKEYSQEDLTRLVGLGEQATELESRWDTKLDRLMPEYSKSREELKTLKEQAVEAAKTKIETKEASGEDMSEEAKSKLVREELKKYGVMTKEDFEQELNNREAGRRILAKTEDVLSKAKEAGLPETNVEEMLTYMQTKGLGAADPQDVYDLMFKDKLRAIEVAKLAGLRPNGLVTEGSSTAGAKTPPIVQVTKDNLGQMLDAVLTRGGGQ